MNGYRIGSPFGLSGQCTEFTFVTFINISGQLPVNPVLPYPSQVNDMFSLLYVDDEPALLEIGQLFLEGTGEFTVRTVESGGEALDLLGRASFDAIISDYQMPGMDGIELLKAVRKTSGNIPFILFTGRGREEIVIGRSITGWIPIFRKEGIQRHSLSSWPTGSARQSAEERQRRPFRILNAGLLISSTSFRTPCLPSIRKDM